MLMLKNILLFIILLSVIVIIHELGHLIVAKIFNVYCAEFSIGMGPKLFSKKGKETEYSIRAIPYGGFVAMAGDTDNSLETSVDTTEIPYERTLPGVSPIKRILIMLAGIMMNFLLAIFIMAILLLNQGSYFEYPDATLSKIENNSAAAIAGLKAGDKVIKITLEDGNSVKPKTFVELSTFLNNYDGKGKVYFEVDRNGEIINISVLPEFNQAENRYFIGIYSGEYKEIKVSISNCIKYAFKHLLLISRMLLSALAGLVFGRGLNNLSGPIGIYNTTAEAISRGPDYYFELMALISLNVGIFNALPLPILDGGRVVITIIETIIRKPLSPKLISIIMGISIGILVLLLLIAGYQDILRLVG